MDIHYPTIDEPATPDYVLAVLQDIHRQQSSYDSEADPEAVLTLDTTIEEWRAACDLVGWRALGDSLNDMWDIACSEAAWREALEPAGRKQLADICQLIAGQTTRPRIRPARLFGDTCAPAGAFLTIRSLFHQAGVEVGEIAPSTLLEPYARRYVEVFLGPVSRLAPGSLPQVRIRTPVHDAALWVHLAALLCLVIGACSGLHLVSLAGTVLAAASTFALSRCPTSWLLPASVEFGELRTFRDLAHAVAEADPA